MSLEQYSCQRIDWRVTQSATVKVQLVLTKATTVAQRAKQQPAPSQTPNNNNRRRQAQPKGDIGMLLHNFGIGNCVFLCTPSVWPKRWTGDWCPDKERYATVIGWSKAKVAVRMDNGNTTNRLAKNICLIADKPSHKYEL